MEYRISKMLRLHTDNRRAAQSFLPLVEFPWAPIWEARECRRWEGSFGTLVVILHRFNARRNLYSSGIILLGRVKVTNSG